MTSPAIVPSMSEIPVVCLMEHSGEMARARGEAKALTPQ